MKKLISDRYACRTEDVAEFIVSGDLSQHSGYFRLGSDVVYGRCSSGAPVEHATGSLHDALDHAVVEKSSVQLPFDPTQIVDSLQAERYFSDSNGHKKSLSAGQIVRNLYYLARPLMPVAVRKHFQRLHLRGWDQIPFPKWPVDRTVENVFDRMLALSMRSKGITKMPFIWLWPDGAPSCSIVTHDVETQAGVDFCPTLMDLNDSFGIKTAFQVVPEKRYPVPDSYLEAIRSRGFEVNIHDLNHDGHLFSERKQFLERAQRINQYAGQFQARGFRAAVLYRNIDWFDAFEVAYDMSIPNVAHLDPQRGGCCTVFPFFAGNILEIPVTVTQDYSLFNILQDYSIRLWQQQISLIREKHGLISVIVHPDYIIDQAARRVYSELLQYLSDLRSQGQTWIALPGEVNDWWRLRRELKLVDAGGHWRIEGAGSQRARLAYATLSNGAISYELST